MRKFFAGLVVLVSISALASITHGKSEAPPKPEVSTDEQKVAYTMGFLNGQNTLRYRLRPDEWAAFLAGLNDAYAKKPALTDPEATRPKIQQFVVARDAEGAAENKRLGIEALTKAAAEPGAKKAASGMVYKTTKEGSGPSPTDTDQVKAKYRGTLVDGTEFDSSEKHGGAVTFGVGGVIPCWTEALKMMKVGEMIDLYCPSEIAYGDRGAPPRIPGGAALHFTIELVEIVPKVAPLPAAPGTAEPKPAP